MTEDNVVDLNTDILISIRDELRELRGALKSEIGALRTDMHGHLGSLHAAVELLELETINGFTGVRRELVRVNDRLDNFIGVASGGHRNHEQRITALECAASRRRGSRRRPPER